MSGEYDIATIGGATVVSLLAAAPSVVVPPAVTSRQARTSLSDDGKLAAVRTAVASTITTLATSMSLSTQQRDALLAAAATMP